MASTINGTSTGSGGLISTGDDSGILNIQTNETTAVTIDASQNVGIGTSSPSSKLSVGGNTPTSGTIAGVASAGGRSLALSDNTNSSLYVIHSSLGIATICTDPGGALAFATNGTTERARIDSSGNFGIGTTSPSSLLQVAGASIFQDSLRIFNTPTSSAQGILFRNTFNVGPSQFSMGTATTNGLIDFIGGSGTQGGISGNGAGISYTSASDYRLKENVAPMTNALGVVAQLKPCTYTWKYNDSAGQGFIAHELQEVFPDAVTGKKDDVETYTDEDGNEQTKIKPQGVDTSFLVATLTAAIQEQQALINALTARIVALDETLTEIKARFPK